MAGSRLDKIGTIYSRMQGLLRSGAIKPQDRPVWYDVYEVFPPKYEPHYDRTAQKSEIPEIFYKENQVRGDFFKKFGLNPGGIARDLKNLSHEEVSQKFVKCFFELAKTNPDRSYESLFNEAVHQYKNEIRDSSESDSIREAESEIGQKIVWKPRKTPILTADSLRSMFDEAKETNKGETTANKDSSSK